MAEKKFSELPSAASLTGNELAALSQTQSGSLASVKSTLQAIANWFAVYAQYTTALQTTDKSIAGAINELKQLISLIPQFAIEVVEELPTEDISDTTIYLVPAEDPEVGNYYEEYIHINDAWELVGTTSVDLSAYYTKLEVDGLLADKLEADDFEANQTASANPITLETKQAGLAKSCAVSFGPVQDLNGYPNPWPGGAGKNKYPILVGNDTEINNNASGTHSTGTNGELIVTTSTGLASGCYFLSSSTLRTLLASMVPCYVSFDVVCSESATVRIGNEASSSSLINVSTTKQRVIQEFTSASSFVIYGNRNAVTITISNLMISATSETQYYPYSNICPISGRTEASVTRTGVNQWDEEWEVIGSNLRSKNYIKVCAGATYYRKSPSNLYIWTYDESYTEVGYFAWGKNGTFTIPSGVGYIKFMVDPAYGSTYNNDISINYPSTDTEYHASAGTETHTKEFGQTVYSGTLDLNSGLLTIDEKEVDLGDFTWTQGNVGTANAYFYSNALSDFKYISETAINYISSNYRSISASQRYQNGTVFINNAKQVIVKDDKYTDAQTFKTAMDGVQLCYELATPTTVQLSPEAVTLLKGLNVISTDGDKVQVEFSDIPVGDYSTILDYVKSLEDRIKALEG